MSIQSTRPSTKREFMDKLVTPYDPRYPNPNQIPSEPYKAGQPEQNRSKEISLKDDREKDFSVGIKDINEAVDYYFKNVLKLSVIQNNTGLIVPIIYGSPENWKSVQEDGYYRDANSKLMAPLLMYRRTNLTQNRNLGSKLDGNSAKNIQLFEKKYSNRNIYSNFGILGNRPQEKEYVAAVTPDYVTITYSCIIWTHFIEQMDKIIESLNYASRSYWGDPSKFQFLSAIDSFDDQSTFSTGEDRFIKSSFTISLNGWLIPNTMNKTLSAFNRVSAVSKVVFGLETSSTAEEFIASQNKPNARRLTSIITADSQNITVNQTISNVGELTIQYINTNKQLAATFVNNTTVTFPSEFLVAPLGLPATSVDNFTFFCNGQFIEKSAIVSFSSSLGVSTLVINPVELDYSFEISDEVIAIGKFV